MAEAIRLGLSHISAAKGTEGSPKRASRASRSTHTDPALKCSPNGLCECVDVPMWQCAVPHDDSGILISRRNKFSRRTDRLPACRLPALINYFTLPPNVGNAFL